MLIYHPAFDNYHCMIRILKVLENLPKQKYSYDRIRIYDYFFLFPNDLRKITIPTALRHYKVIKAENKYNTIHNPIEVFRRISGFQYLALNALASYDLIDNALFQEKIILRTDKKVPFELNLRDFEQKYLEFLTSYASKLALKELKERTKLMEHRYELS